MKYSSRSASSRRPGSGGPTSADRPWPPTSAAGAREVGGLAGRREGESGEASLLAGRQGSRVQGPRGARLCGTPAASPLPPPRGPTRAARGALSTGPLSTAGGQAGPARRAHPGARNLLPERLEGPARDVDGRVVDDSGHGRLDALQADILPARPGARRRGAARSAVNCVLPAGCEEGGGELRAWLGAKGGGAGAPGEDLVPLPLGQRSNLHEEHLRGRERATRRWVGSCPRPQRVVPLGHGAPSPS